MQGQDQPHLSQPVIAMMDMPTQGERIGQTIIRFVSKAHFKIGWFLKKVRASSTWRFSVVREVCAKAYFRRGIEASTQVHSAVIDQDSCNADRRGHSNAYPLHTIPRDELDW
jgi:hypothetical protein